MNPVEKHLDPLSRFVARQWASLRAAASAAGPAGLVNTYMRFVLKS